jgi:hypothetical protein
VATPATSAAARRSAHDDRGDMEHTRLRRSARAGDDD